MKRIIILTDGTTLGIVRPVADRDVRGDVGPALVGSWSGTGAGSWETDRSHTEDSAAERLEFIDPHSSSPGRKTGIREIADSVNRIVREEHVDFWHLVAPPAIKRRLAEFLDEDVHRRLSRIGFGELVAAAVECAAESHAAPSWHSAGQSQ